ncbi:TIGR03985 family CRISPR-associated protein [Leptolyngbya sp. 'hensonii']|uniref:TIGR03985 family CRISPR-associated protein n=1 Tax=Leptolyngbya sp. 'hensonii' TaxID=1922337 RepID=UPI00209A9534|nr:TIGR03985 family CRISPR-associated protein [Leptolyngbya sp. 'hensonii']
MLQWLSAGQLGNRLQRTVRLWVLLSHLYGPTWNWAIQLPQPFSYPDLRDRLFAPTHKQSDNLSIEVITSTCTDPSCACHQTMQAWLSGTHLIPSEPRWLEEMIHLTGLSMAELQGQLQLYPFATVHRSLREDLKLLAKLGWLQSSDRGSYLCQIPAHWPEPPTEVETAPELARLSSSETWDLLRALESVSFMQPNLEPTIQALWDQATKADPPMSRLEQEPTQRIFLELEYILFPDTQDRVDTYQDQLTQLWRKGEGGVITFEYFMARAQKQVQVIVHPVCIHYVRRAKYLSAYGLDPEGQIGWHNYRLDRIVSDRLRILPWGDPLVPKALKDLWHAGQLYTPDYVREQLRQAWGFNFYLRRELLLLRFPRAFAHGYVEDTVRHETFRSIAYKKIPALLQREHVPEPEQQQILALLQQRSAKDAYYHAWVRIGDINVTMRLRDWRPNGEVLAPCSLRQQMAEEATQELAHYQDLT